MSAQWEYLTAVDISPDDLKSLGYDGWELVSKTYVATQAISQYSPLPTIGYNRSNGSSHSIAEYIFKRPSVEKAAPAQYVRPHPPIIIE